MATPACQSQCQLHHGHINHLHHGHLQHRHLIAHTHGHFLHTHSHLLQSLGHLHGHLQDRPHIAHTKTESYSDRPHIAHTQTVSYSYLLLKLHDRHHIAHTHKVRPCSHDTSSDRIHRSLLLCLTHCLLLCVILIPCVLAVMIPHLIAYGPWQTSEGSVRGEGCGSWEGREGYGP